MAGYDVPQSTIGQAARPATASFAVRAPGRSPVAHRRPDHRDDQRPEYRGGRRGLPLDAGSNASVSHWDFNFGNGNTGVFWGSTGSIQFTYPDGENLPVTITAVAWYNGTGYPSNPHVVMVQNVAPKE